MYTYKKLYHDLFNAITDALRDLEAGQADAARDRLIRAQQDAEDHYLDDFDDSQD